MKVIGPNITPDVGGIYIHVKSGNRYEVVAMGMVKINGEWKHSVNYVREDGSNATTFTRTIGDFQASFADADGVIEV